MNIESSLLSKALSERNLTNLFERGVNETWFNDPSDKKLWNFVREHFFKYGECPSLDVVSSNFPTYKIVEVNDSIEYLMDSLLTARRKSSTIAMISNAIEAIEKDKDHEAALIRLQSGLIKLEEDGLTTTSDVDITKDPLSRWNDYEHRKSNPGLLGIPTGFPTMDLATSGLQKGQLIVIVAPPKTGKSTLALQIAQNVHFAGKVPMFQSFEMSNSEQLTRYDAMRARVSHTRLITGTLTPEEETRYLSKLDSMSKMRDKFWLVDAASGSTVSGIASKIQVLQPDVVFIDGTYLMIDEQTGEANTPQALTNITRSLKRLAQRFQIPIVISTQVLNWKMRKGQVTADSIGYSSSFHQDADVIFGLQKEDEAIDDTRLLKVLASRNSGLTEVSMIWDWNSGQFREMEEDDL
jgi:replicative DNA helicase